MGEDSARRLPEDSQKKSSSALNVRRLPRRLPWKSSKSVSDLKNMHIQKHSNGFKHRKTSKIMYELKQSNEFSKSKSFKQ